MEVIPRTKVNKKLSPEIVAKVWACEGKLKYKSIAKVLGLEYYTVWRIMNITKRK